MRIAILSNEYQKKEQITRILNILSGYDVEIYIQKEFCDYLKAEFNLFPTNIQTFTGNNFDADFVFSIGGDGTFLRTVMAIGEKQIPILGINTGHLGFLADINEDSLNDTLQELQEGRYRIEDRAQLQVTFGNEILCGRNYALNELAILKQDTASMITVHVSIDDEYLTSYQADGLVVATPTGSTAYSLSIGGPIMTPKAKNFILTAIAPHSLNARPLVIEDTSTISLEIEGRTKNFLISLDGRSEVLSSGSKLSICKAPSSVRIVKRMGHTFYETLREKLMWGVDPRVK